MNKLLVIGLGLGALALAAQSKAATLAPLPAPLPPEPDVPPPEPVPGVKTPPDVSVTVPAGYRRMRQGEVTKDLQDAALDVLKLGDKPGTKYPFGVDGVQYYAGVEMSNGKRNISLCGKG
jgi:hypothetical protein